MKLKGIDDVAGALGPEKVLEVIAAAYDPKAKRKLLLSFQRNDYGNRERLLATHGPDMQYWHDRKKWLLWDGRRWVVDESDGARDKAIETILEYQRQALEQQDEEHRKFASASLGLKHISDMLTMAQHPLNIKTESLDIDPYLLNFNNGTVELCTSELRPPHHKEDFITKLIPYDYNPDTPCDLWLHFLCEVMGGRENPERAEEFIVYMQRALGYSLTGMTSEKVVFIPYGSGDNAKTTLLTVFREIVKDYAALLQIETLMTRQLESNNTQADLADLRGARFVQTSEAEEGQRLSQGKLKRITQGMGTIKAVRKYENPVIFAETHKLWLDTNKKPTIRDADDRATFNRLHPIPFTVQIPKDKIDKEMPRKLLQQAECILAWAVEGARLWHESGLRTPREIEEAKEAYRAECDQLGRFLDDRCVQGDGFSVLASDLYAEYKSWCDANGEKHCETKNALGRRLTNRGFVSRHSTRGERYDKLGLCLRDSTTESET